jgi:hypothetical protein
VEREHAREAGLDPGPDLRSGRIIAWSHYVGRIVALYCRSSATSPFR